MQDRSVESEGCIVWCSSTSGRCRKKLDELERLLDIAKKNYVQLGGKLAEDRRKLKEDRDSKRYDRRAFCFPLKFVTIQRGH